MEDTKFECRACLEIFEAVDLYNLFQTWNQLWQGFSDNVIAMDLARLAHVQLSEIDSFSKLICKPCLLKLKEACQFAALVKLNDTLLRQRFINIHVPSSNINDLGWPKPMTLESNELRIKEEMFPDDGHSTQYNSAVNNNEASNKIINFADVDIKLEPEEILQPSIQIVVNGTLAEDDYQGLSKSLENGGDGGCGERNNLDSLVKTEPLSEEEEEQVSDLPLECMLCAKIFKKMSGLKAHVIAHHSYKSVRRKSGIGSPQKTCGEKMTCAICHRNFVTLTDLMVHETCHNKAVCYGCGQKCDTFQQLIKHRSRCKALRSTANKPVKPKTLVDVIRNHTLPNKEIQTSPTMENQKSLTLDIQTLPEKEIQISKAKENNTSRTKGIESNEIKSRETITVDMKTGTNVRINLLESNRISETIDIKEEVNCQDEMVNEKLQIKGEHIELLHCSHCNEEFSNMVFLKIHEQMNHENSLNVNPELKTMKTELLDSLFDDS